MARSEASSSTEARRAAAAGSLADDVDGILVTGAENVRYLTGFTGSNGATLLSRAGDTVLATDGRYVIRAAKEAPGIEVIEASRLGPALVERAISTGLRRIGIEAHCLTVEGLGALEGAAAGRLELVAAGRPVEALRVVKDDGEIASLRTACELTDAVFTTVVAALRTGMTEQDVEWSLVSELRAAGAEGPSFPAIVAFGPHAAIPHHRPTARPLKHGDLVKLDFGALVDGYHADLTRTVVVESAADWQRDLHEAVLMLQAELCEAARPGVAPAELDARMRERIRELGHPVRHGLGHGVGLAIHEDPFLTEASTAPPLAAGMTVTVEPGIYVEGRGGVRIEDTLLVTDGEPVVLTTCSRELVEC